ncbi:MAG: apolipoprotein N-acyltransferase [Bacteriovoracales bacterium]|nr:apolipoprotein N-acyltransferase [Bacteriovoracales bacterium]
MAGALYALGFPSSVTPALVFAPPLALALLLTVWAPKRKEQTLRKQIQLLLPFCLGAYVAGYYWLAFTLKEFGQIPFPANHLLGIALSVLLMPHFWAFLLLRKLFVVLSQRFPRLSPPPSYRLPLAALGLTLLESFIPQQFPAHLGHSWITLAPFLGLAPIFGAPLFSFMSAYGGLALAHFFSTKRADPSFIWALALFLAANAFFPLPPYRGGEIELSTRIVQANIGSALKVAAEKGFEGANTYIENRYRHLSLKESAKPLDLIIWPETAVPNPLNSHLIARGRKGWPPFIEEVIRGSRAQMAVGVYDSTGSSRPHLPPYFESEYNALFHIGRDGELKGRYRKHRLIPFGETMPFGPLNPFLSKVFVHVSFFARGDGLPLFVLDGGARFIPAICYEILFPRFINRYLDHVESRGGGRPHFILNLTNDSWYGPTSEPHQHLFLSRWRALETGLPVIRSTNTGITSVLYPDGSRSKSMGVGEEGVLDLTLSLGESRATPYGRYGLGLSLAAMVWICGLPLFLGFFLGFLRRRFGGFGSFGRKSLF